MKVAIIGAGISGLSCAIELQRLGIDPTIFEKTKILGDKPGYLTAHLRLFHRSFRSPMSFFKSKYDIDIAPLHPINKIIQKTPNITMVTKAHHGYVFSKNIEANSLEHQLAAHLDGIPILFDREVKIPDIINDFDHIVVATGSNVIARDLNLWNTTFMAKVRIATFMGNFERDAMIIWLNKNFAHNGYGYLLAKNSTEAEICLAVSDITMDKLDYYWNEFIKTEHIDHTLVKYHDVEHVIGFPSANRYGKIYFTGNTGGMIDDFLGFGFTRSIESGILAARAIVNGQNYDMLLKKLKKQVYDLSEYRKMIDVLTDKDYDLDMSILGLPVIKQMVYNNVLYKAKYGVIAPKTIVSFKKENHPFKLAERKRP